MRAAMRNENIPGNKMKYFLSIAATDSSGGAGILRDALVANDLGYWPLSVVTAVTSQSFTSVYDIFPLPVHVIEKQLKTCFDNFPVHCVKVGAMINEDIVKTITSLLRKSIIQYLVLDPVIAASDGTPLLTPNAIQILKEELLPMATVVTPNIHELELLTGVKCSNKVDAREAGLKLSSEIHTAVLVKGGHLSGGIITDFLQSEKYELSWEHEREGLAYTHGTGCVFSSALTCFLGYGLSLCEAYQKASAFMLRFFIDAGKRYSNDVK